MDPDDMIIDDAPPAFDAMDDVEDGEVDPTEVCANKVFLTGLNEKVFTQDVSEYVRTHYPSEEFEKIEWINDNSVNIVYTSEFAAAEALEAFSTTSHPDPLQPRPARAIAALAETELTARLATVTDVKKAGAAAESRFYLQNPDEDPTNRPPRHKRRPHGGRGPVDRSELHRYRSRDYNDKNPSAGLNYDDEPTQERGGARRDIIDTRGYSRLRDRSASPTRDGDGRNGFPDDQPHRRSARPRSRSPPRRGRDNRGARDLLANDLFSKQSKSAAPVAPSDRAAARELFPDRATHRRQDAQHLSSADVAHAIGNYHLSDARDDGGRAELFPARRSDPSYGRLTDGSPPAVVPDQDNDRGFSIRGAGSDRGFSILGASREGSRARAIELYPQKISAANAARAAAGKGGQHHRRVTAQELI